LVQSLFRDHELQVKLKSIAFLRSIDPVDRNHSGGETIITFEAHIVVFDLANQGSDPGFFRNPFPIELGLLGVVSKSFPDERAKPMF
jgi:hypothetical protein